MLGVEKVTGTGWMTAGLAWWSDSHPANWTGDGTKLISNGSNGDLAKSGFWTTGKTYRTKTTHIINSGSLYGPYDWSTGGFDHTVSGNATEYHVPTTAYISMRSVLLNGTITAFSVKEVLMP